MNYAQEHPHPKIDWACPECESTEIAYLARNPKARGHMQPPGYCYECGVRFTTPKEKDLPTEGL